MKSDWRISTNYIAGEKHYEVYRLLDADAVVHSGNRETKGIFNDREAAEEYCRMLNAEIKMEDLIEKLD